MMLSLCTGYAAPLPEKLRVEVSGDPSHFTIGVNMQHPSLAEQYAAAGINQFVGVDWPGVTADSLKKFADLNITVITTQTADTLKLKDSPVIVGWDIGWDEPDNAQGDGHGGYGPCIEPSKVQQRYAQLKKADPTRPIYMNFGRGVADTSWVGRGVCTGKTDMYNAYMKACDVCAYDIYPANGGCDGNFTCVYQGLENLHAWDPRKGTAHPTPLGMALETGPIGDDASKSPTPADLRSEVWMTLISGATSINYFVHRFTKSGVDTSYLLKNPTMLAAVTKVNQEITSLAPVLNAANCSASAATVDDDRIAILARACSPTGMYLFAVNLAATTVTPTFTVTSGSEVHTLGYDEPARNIPLVKAKFGDTFAKYQVHLYRLS